MSEHERKRAHDDLPAVHKPPKAMAKSGRDNPAKAAVDHEELRRLTGRLRNAHDPHERSALLSALEHQFGSATADRVVAELAHESGTHKEAHGNPPHGAHE